MTVTSLFASLPFGPRKAEALVGTDADALMVVWGGAAYDVANQMSWREDSGLMHAATPGHWGRVSQEIGRRLGIKEPVALGRRRLAA